MNFLPRRNRQKNTPRHALTVVAQAPETAVTDGPGETFSAAPAAAPDDTVLFRILAADGGPGFVIPPGSPWSTSQDTLRDVRDALQALPALPAEPRHDDGEDEEPAAYLRAIVPGGDTGTVQIQDALGHSPRFAGSGLLADGRPVAGMYLGTNEDGWFVLDALTAEWCDDVIAALEEMRDCLEAASGQAEDGAAA